MGEYVEADEVVARIETDKVTVDILSQHSGVIKKFFAEEGDTVEVGGDLMEIDTDGKPTEGAAPATPAVSRARSSFSIYLIIILPISPRQLPLQKLPKPPPLSQPRPLLLPLLPLLLPSQLPLVQPQVAFSLRLPRRPLLLSKAQELRPALR